MYVSILFYTDFTVGSTSSARCCQQLLLAHLLHWWPPLGLGWPLRTRDGHGLHCIGQTLRPRHLWTVPSADLPAIHTALVRHREATQ